MYEATFELETITPLFMRGADQGKAEFRSASVKGVMRWWFRALAGNYFGKDIEALRRAECRVFGCAGKETKRSRVIIDVKNPQNKIQFINKTADSWDNATIWSKYVDYFFFSVVDKRRRGNDITMKSRFSFYGVDSEFSLTLRSSDEFSMKMAQASLWALTYLGGLGFRSRRGAGSLGIIKCRGDIFFNFNPSRDRFGEELKDIINAVKKELEGYGFNQGSLTSIPLYPHFHNKYSAVFIGKVGKKTWVNALDDFGKWYLGIKRGKKFKGGFRFKHADYTLSHNIEKVNTSSTLESEKERRYFLGLPLNYFNYKTIVTGDSFERRASEIIVSVSKFGDKLYPVVSLFGYQLHPKYNGRFKFVKKTGNGKIEGKIFLEETDNRSVVEFYREAISSLENNSTFTRICPLRKSGHGS